MNIKIGLLNKISFCYLFIGVILFLAFWLKLVYAIPSIFALICILRSIFISQNKNQKEFFLDKKFLYAVLAICFIWCFVAGIGGFFWQSRPDWTPRNAILRDLTHFAWPVIYDNGSALVYYFGFMLPSALFGKFTLLFSDNNQLIDGLTRTFSLFWSVIGVFLSMLHLIILTNAKNKKVFIALLIFMAYSGMNFLVFEWSHPLLTDWHPPFVYEANSHVLFYSYNICIPIWLITFLLMHHLKDLEYFGTLGFLSFFYYPMLSVTFGIFFVALTIKEFLNNHDILKKIFDIKNILALFVLLPLFVLFIYTNYSSSNSHIYFHKYGLRFYKIFTLEVLIYLLLIGKTYFKNLLFWIVAGILFIYPKIAIVHDWDFCERGTIPAFVILNILIISFFLNTQGAKFRKQILATCLLIGSFTPIGIFIFICQNNYLFPNDKIRDDIYTLNNKISYESGKTYNKIHELQWDCQNYGSIEPEKYFFWKYIAKKYKN